MIKLSIKPDPLTRAEWVLVWMFPKVKVNNLFFLAKLEEE